MREVEDSFWSFSLRVYAAPGVADACLWLQDHRGLDVNRVLFSVWAGLLRGELQDSALAEAERVSRDWSERVVQSLRAARRGLDSGEHPELRADIQRVELAAEKIQQERLERLVLRGSPGALLPPPGREAARLNLSGYLETAGVALEREIASRFTQVIDAAVGEAPRAG